MGGHGANGGVRAYEGDDWGCFCNFNFILFLMNYL